jgi:DNA-binding winged helix-turn-helix (wHTH) protein
LLYDGRMLRLDAKQGVLFRDGERVVLVPKAAALLRALAEHAGRIASKNELMAAVWPDVTVEEGNLAKLVFLLRKELGDASIETVPRRGYRLVAAVQLAEPPRAVDPAAWDLYIQGRYL